MPATAAIWESHCTALLSLCVVAGAAAYTIHRAITLRVEYYDGYEYLMNARALLGDRVAQYGIHRPPFVTLAQLPAVAFARAGPPCALRWLVAPHVIAAALALATAGAVYWVLRRPLGMTLATLGSALFMVTPCFVRYGAHVLADLPSAGSAAGAVALYSRARERPSPAGYVACGFALGVAALTKYPLAILPGVLFVAEAAFVLVERRFDWWRWAGVVLATAAAATLVVATLGAIFVVVAPGDVWRNVVSSFAILRLVAAFVRVLGIGRGESWLDYVEMGPAFLSTPTLVLAAVGLLRAAIERDARDIPFLAWLLVVGGSIARFEHTEGRYLLPAVPALVYFSARGAGYLLVSAESPARTLRRAAAGVLLAWAAASGVRQAALDRDPVFLTDIERRAAALLLQLRRPPGRLIWLGAYHALHTRNPTQVPRDEYFNLFHYAPFIVSYFTGERVIPLRPVAAPEALASQLIDGDAVIRAADRFYTADALPRGGLPPLEVWAIRSLELTPSGEGALVAPSDRSVRFRFDTSEGGRVMVPEGDFGTWTVFVATGVGHQLTSLGAHELGRGARVTLGQAYTDPPSRVLLFHIDSTTLELPVTSRP